MSIISGCVCVKPNSSLVAEGKEGQQSARYVARGSLVAVLVIRMTMTKILIMIIIIIKSC